MARPDLPTHRPWLEREPDRLIGRGHPAGDFLEAYDWKVLLEAPGKLHLDVHVAPAVRNPLGQVFGGFAPTYVDLVALFTVRATLPRDDDKLKEVLATANMRVDYMEPLVGPRFLIESERVKQRGRNHWVETRFLQDGELALFALTTLRAIPRPRKESDTTS
jgi:acyl-coenzyme A thioesterase PaaI-like protein